MKLNKNIVRISALLLGGLGAFAAILSDTAPYRKALAAVAAYEAGNGENEKKLKADINRYLACSDLTTKNQTEFVSRTYSKEARDCLITGMKELETWQGSKVFATLSTAFLVADPDDEGLRMAAMAAIEKGRTDLIRSKLYFNLLEDANKARHRSMFHRIAGGAFGSATLGDFYSQTEKFDHIEFTLLLPKVAARQESWRSDALSRVAGS